ncbi:hypothetical protein I5Q34_32885 [Streptomyces sp. AV19]|uniref:sensor histidine kinase n=1 Tax=Streptomyces sp. AV19 TaxID=2793068 RepID=UPI0018FEA565|nr:histidine kinase [Streptomyces sp. AV19]MBH1939000.1 hypothetical protein [Streptomyces sp. AV19]MDG4536870.1 histidine kinase [Streptomyces sp. AV19]
MNAFKLLSPDSSAEGILGFLHITKRPSWPRHPVPGLPAGSSDSGWVHRFLLLAPEGMDRKTMWDIGIALLVGFASCLELPGLDATGLVRCYFADVAIAIVAAATLLVRRHCPEVCLLAGLAAGFAFDERILLFAGAYSVAHYGGRLRFPLVATVAVIYTTTRCIIGTADDTFAMLCCDVVLEIVFPAVFGSIVRDQKALRDLLRQRLEKSESAVDNAVRYALLEERTRLAFDIHDHIGHHATFLVLRASALQQLPSLCDEARKGATALQESAQRIMSDLRQMLKALRDTSTQRTELVGSANCADFLAGLAKNMSAVGMAVEYELHGTVKQLPQDVEVLLHRLCHETFTNAAKHAPGALIRADLSFQADQVTLEVSNGPATGSVLRSSGCMGLVGLRRRVAEVGGQLTVGPTHDGGFRVAAALPAALPE